MKEDIYKFLLKLFSKKCVNILFIIHFQHLIIFMAKFCYNKLTDICKIILNFVKIPLYICVSSLSVSLFFFTFCFLLIIMLN